MGAAMTGRLERRSFRRGGTSEHQIRWARVRPGREAAVIDLSPGGASIEVSYRLLPGAVIDLQIDTANGRLDARGRVLRCAIVRLRPNAVSYRAAVAFEGEYPLPGCETGSARSAGVDPTRALS
jgi:hypothetical protein